MSLFNVYPLNPITITKAAGSRVWDNQGQEYLDMYGGHAVISIGHTHPHWVKRIEDQLHCKQSGSSEDVFLTKLQVPFARIQRL